VIPLRIIRAAQRDIRKIRRYYDRQSPGLGDEFLAEFAHTGRFIRENPRAATEIRPGIRRALLRRFHYSIIYRLTDAEEAVIVMLMHHKQRPDIWLKRLSTDD